MPIQTNDTLYETIAQEFAVRLVTIVAQQLHSSPHVTFTLDDVSVDAMDLLSNLCFFVAIAYEDRSGVDEMGQRYFPTLAWQEGRSEPLNLIVGHARIHELIDTEVLEAGLERARHMNLPPRSNNSTQRSS